MTEFRVSNQVCANLQIYANVNVMYQHLPILSYSRVSPAFPTWHSDDGCGLLRSACSSLCSRQAGVSSFWCHRLERPASPRRICAVTRGFQTTTQDLSVFPFLPRHYHMTRVLLLPFITTVWTPVGLAAVNIIKAALKMFLMMMMMMMMYVIIINFC